MVGAYLAGNILGLSVSSTFDEATTMDQLATETAGGLLVEVAGGLAFLAVMRTITPRHERAVGACLSAGRNPPQPPLR